MSLSELKTRDPLIYGLIEKYDKSSLECHFSVEEVYKCLDQTIKNKCIEILQLITGQDMNSEEMSDSLLQNTFQSELDQLTQQITENQILTESLEKNFEKYKKVWLLF